MISLKVYCQNIMKKLSLYILTSTFILASCGGGGGGGGSSTPEPVASVSLSASDTDLFPGDTTTLTWSSTIATSCSASGSWTGAGGVSGSQIVTVNEGDNVYSLKCGNSRTASVTVVGIIMPSVSIEVIEDINALKEVVFTATITDPQNRFVSSDWSQTTTTGENFSYNYTDTSITFSPPQQCDYQTITPKLVITVDTANNNNGTTATSEDSTTSRIVPLIPEAPTSFAGAAKSQSADFTWNESTGACSYSYYYAYDNGGLTNDSNSFETTSIGEGGVVSIVNDRKVYFAVSATNVTGESSLSNEVEITATGPLSESTGQPNNTESNFSEIDYYGNVIGSYSGSLSTSAYCVKDNITGAIWGIEKPVDTSALHYTYGTYTYFDDTNVVNGVNDFGNKNTTGTSCSFADDSNSDLNCNTQDYLVSLNSGGANGEAFCGVTNWRLPTQDEVIQNFNLIDDGDYSRDEEIWTSTSINETAPARQVIYAAERYICGDECAERKSKSSEQYVRPISLADNEENEALNFTVQCIDWETAEDQIESEFEPTYTLEQLNDKASLISNQSGVDWVVPTLYELAMFSDLIKESPGKTFKVTSDSGGTYTTQTAVYRVMTATKSSGTTSSRNLNFKRMSDGVLQIVTSWESGRHQMCFKGPVGATITE